MRRINKRENPIVFLIAFTLLKNEILRLTFEESWHFVNKTLPHTAGLNRIRQVTSIHYIYVYTYI